MICQCGEDIDVKRIPSKDSCILEDLCKGATHLERILSPYGSFLPVTKITILLYIYWS
eukprot:UN24132